MQTTYLNNNLNELLLLKTVTQTISVNNVSYWYVNFTVSALSGYIPFIVFEAGNNVSANYQAMESARIPNSSRYVSFMYRNTADTKVTSSIDFIFYVLYKKVL